MKTAIHPIYHTDVTVTCTCGNTFVTGSVKNQIQVEICAACHPFFTGEVKYVDLAGRVDKFIAKQEAAKNLTSKSARKNDKKAQARGDNQSLKEMLEAAQREAKKASRPTVTSENTSTDNQ